MRACADPARTLIYERVGRHMIEPRPMSAGICGICGAKGVPVQKASASSDTGTCIAQLSLTAKRAGAPDGMPLLSTSPSGGGRYSLTDDRCWIVSDADTTTVATKVRPVSPLPESVSVVRPADAGRFEDRVLDMIRDPKPPMLAVRFAKKANMRLSVGHGGSAVAVADRANAVMYDIERVGELVGLLQRFGKRTVDEAATLRRLVAEGSRDAPRLLSELRRREPDLARRIAEAPSGREPEYVLATAMVATPK